MTSEDRAEARARVRALCLRSRDALSSALLTLLDQGVLNTDHPLEEVTEQLFDALALRLEPVSPSEENARDFELLSAKYRKLLAERDRERELAQHWEREAKKESKARG